MFSKLIYIFFSSDSIEDMTEEDQIHNNAVKTKKKVEEILLK